MSPLPGDSMWHVSSRSGVATLQTAIHLLLTYTCPCECMCILCRRPSVHIALLMRSSRPTLTPIARYTHTTHTHIHTHTHTHTTDSAYIFFVTPFTTCSHLTTVLISALRIDNDVLREKQGNRKHQTLSRSSAAPS